MLPVFLSVSLPSPCSQSGQRNPSIRAEKAALAQGHHGVELWLRADGITTLATEPICVLFQGSLHLRGQQQ